jgi:hypothetical protein
VALRPRLRRVCLCRDGLLSGGPTLLLGTRLVKNGEMSRQKRSKVRAAKAKGPSSSARSPGMKVVNGCLRELPRNDSNPSTRAINRWYSHVVV